MEQTVYVDLFFMINFSMDFLCFFLVSQLLSSKLSLPRTLLASALGGIYSCLALFISAGGIFGIFLDICACILMCIICFGRCGHIFGHTAVYVAVSAVLGGFMTVLFDLLNRAELPLEQIERDGISAWLLLLLAVICGAITLFGGKFFKRQAERRRTRVHIELDRKQITLSAICDSGNMLCEPISGRACIIADIEAVSGFLPDCLLRSARVGSVALDEKHADFAKRLRIIPTHTATGDGLLVAVRCDSICIGEEGRAHEVEALLALSELGESADGAKALVPTSLMLI